MMRLRRRDEAGASVVLALVFLSLFGLFISTILTFTESSLLVTKQAAIGADSLYTSDGAVEGAIHHLRNGPSVGVDGAPCDNFEYEGTSVACTPKQGSGVDVGLPEPAIAAYGMHADEGIQVAGGDLAVGGDVVSNSKIVLQAPHKMNVYGDASATACEPAGSVVAMRGGQVNCQATVPVPEPSTHPKFIKSPLPEPGSGELPRVEPPATDACLGLPRTISLDPGYYDDAGKLNALTGPGSLCKGTGKVIHFRPGLYYFDFGSGQSTPCSEPSTSCEWVIDLPTGGVIGGQPAVDGPDPFAAPLPPQGNCLDNDVRGNGVQFVFGGDSRLSISSGTVELCGERTVDGKEAVVYGLPSRPLRDRIASGDLENTPGGGGEQADFLPVEQARTIDGSLSKATLKDSLTKASLDFEFPMMIPEIPEGASIDDVTLRIRHKESGDLSNVALSAIVSGAKGPPASPEEQPPQVDVGPNATLTEEEFDLRSLGFDTFEELNARIDITFVATRSGGEVSVLLDGIELAIGYTTPTAPHPLAVKPFSAASVPANSFLPDDNLAARIIDGSVAKATLNSTTSTASVDVGFSPATSPLAVPSTAAIQTAILRVAHAEVGDEATSLGLKVQVTPSAGPPLAEQTLAADNPTLAEDQIDLKALGLDTPEELNAGMGVRFTATWLKGGNVTESLDGMELFITYNLLAASVVENGFSPNGAAKDIDGVVAGATLNVTNPSASVAFEFPKLAGPGAVPPGATINGALLRVAHAETAASGILDLEVVVTPDQSTGVPQGSQKLPPDNIELAEDTVDLMALGLDTPAKLNARMAVAFNAKYLGLGDVAAVLDGIELAIFYTPPPTFRPPAADSCLIQPTYGQAGSCPLLRVVAGARMVIHGGVYAPRAPIDIALQDDLVLVERGMATRTFRAAVSASLTPTPPEESCSFRAAPTREPRTVTLSTASPVDIQATVQFDDEPASDPCGPAKVTVLDWGVGRGP